MLDDLLFTLWFFLPAGIANTAPVFASKMPFLRKFDYPLDFNLKLNGKRILGSHKTIRGIISAIVVAIVIVVFQKYIYLSIQSVSDFVRIDYSEVNSYLLGFLLGAGAIIGDAVKSFFKRRVEVKPGKPWIPFDQTDYIFGGVLFSAFYVRLTFDEYLLLFIIWSILHPLSSIIGYALKLKKDIL